MSEDTPNWGIEPVPDRLRVLGLADLTLLWGSLGVSLLVLVAGALLVPALSLPRAFLAILVGGLIGNLMLGLAGMIGADARVPAMVLLRAPLGRHGSYLATVLNVAQCLGWAIFELIIIATAASALSDRAFGFEGRWLWTLVFGAVTAALALLGPVGVVRRFLRRFGAWVVLASLAYLTWWALDGADLGALWSAPADGGSSVWEGIDLVVALTVTWIPLAADYTRFARDRTRALVGTGVGYLIPTFWMFGLGAVLVLSRGLDDPAALPAAVASAGLASALALLAVTVDEAAVAVASAYSAAAAALPSAVASAGLASALALLAVTVDEADEAFANAYSAAVSAQNVLTRVPQRALVLAASLAATVGALAIDLGSYTTFLYMLGSFFVPLFGVLLADWLVAGASYGERDVFAAPALRPGLVAAWLAGFALYQWLYPQGPGWWVDLVERLDPQSLGIGSTLPSFALSFVAAGAIALLGRRTRPASVPA